MFLRDQKSTCVRKDNVLRNSTGSYSNLAACQDHCTPPTPAPPTPPPTPTPPLKYLCKEGQCVKNSTGSYSNLAVCQDHCTPPTPAPPTPPPTPTPPLKYLCKEGQCKQSASGVSLDDCQKSCPCLCVFDFDRTLTSQQGQSNCSGIETIAASRSRLRVDPSRRHNELVPRCSENN